MNAAPYVENARSPQRLVLGALAALGLHGAALVVALQCEVAPLPPALKITEVDLTPVVRTPPPEPPPAVEPAPVEPLRPAARAPTPRAQAKAPSAAPAPPAAAGNLHTAKEDAPTDSEPVRFAVDATGAGYGFGVVAVGGSGNQRGGTGTAQAPAPVAAVASDGGGAQLRRFAVPPRLDEADPCRGFFPDQASVDRGEVTLKLIVSSQGRVERATVLSEQPTNQGFGKSAIQCLRQKRFVPAQDEQGRPQAAEAPVAVRFSR